MLPEPVTCLVNSVLYCENLEEGGCIVIQSPSNKRQLTKTKL